MTQAISIGFFIILAIGFVLGVQDYLKKRDTTLTELLEAFGGIFKIILLIIIGIAVFGIIHRFFAH